MNVRTLAGKNVVVTGAGSGIGRATAVAAGRRGARLFLCDVNAAGLDETAKLVETAGGTASKAVVDVASADAMRAFADGVHAEVPAVDLLVNNAGVGLGANFADTSLDDWRWVLDINLMGVVHGCHFFVPRMVERAQGGHVVNIASMAGFTPTAATTAYCVTKSGVLALSECLRIELSPHAIGVTAICPGLIDTPIVTSGRRRGFASLPRAQAMIKSTFERRGYSPERVAENILRAVQKDRTVAPVSPEAWTFYFLKRFAPALTLRLSGWMGRRVERDVRKGEP